MAGGLCAGWFVGLSRRVGFVPLLSELLLASEVVYAGQGYCLALAVIGKDECVYSLRAYLDKYLPLNGKVYNQDWAIGALAHIKGEMPSEYLHREMWQDGKFSIDPAEAITDFSKLIFYLRQHGMLDVRA
jgi:hypothetical protein